MASVAAPVGDAMGDVTGVEVSILRSGLSFTSVAVSAFTPSFSSVVDLMTGDKDNKDNKDNNSNNNSNNDSNNDSNDNNDNDNDNDNDEARLSGHRKY